MYLTGVRVAEVIVQRFFMWFVIEVRVLVVSVIVGVKTVSIDVTTLLTVPSVPSVVLLWIFPDIDHLYPSVINIRSYSFLIPAA